MTTEYVNEEIRNFQVAYCTFTKKQKKIFDYLHWFSKKYQVVFPSQSTIAKATGCSRDTVIQAIKLFRELGLVYTYKRLKSGWSSLIYLIKEDILKLDLTKPSTWFRRSFSVSSGASSEGETQSKTTNEPTNNPTLLNDLGECKLNDYETVQTTSVSKKDSSSPEEKKRYKKHEEMPPEMSNIPLKENDKKSLWYGIKKTIKASYQDRVTALRMAYEDLQTYCMKKAVYKPGAFLCSRMKAHLGMNC